MPKKTSGAGSKKKAAGAGTRKKTSRGQTASGAGGGSPREHSLRKQLLQNRNELLRETQEEISKYIKGENRQLVESALDGGDRRRGGVIRGRRVV